MAIGASLPPVSLTSAQAVALMAAVSAASDALSRIWRPPGSGRSWMSSTLEPAHGPTRWPIESGWMRCPRRHVRSGRRWKAMADQRVVRLRYTAGDGTTTARDVEPVLFASTNGQWYLVGWCRLRDAMRWFAVSRIERTSVTTTPCAGHAVDEVGEPPATASPVYGRLR
jgi:predicted DNA-binding transcriptional regulator YafY